MDPKTIGQRILKLGKNLESDIEKALIKAAIAADQAAVLATPVDTGRARANWIVTLDESTPAPEDKFDKTGADTRTRNASTLQRFQLREGRGVITLSNNVSYIIFLERGSSAQAPNGMLQAAVLAGVSKLKAQRYLT